LIRVVLSESYYCNEDVVFLAKDLLGKLIQVAHSDGIVSAFITETEAYAGVVDKASHAYNGRRTSRTEVMYQTGGVAYVYLCYGVHYLFNVVTGPENVPHAVLIRGVVPFEGVDLMVARRNLKTAHYKGFNGPGKLTSALGINITHNAARLTNGTIQILDTGIRIAENEIITSKRIGVDYAAEDALLPYRFQVTEPWMAKKNVLF
jgi:DNA-3-methyladenine glycosylase